MAIMPSETGVCPNGLLLANGEFCNVLLLAAVGKNSWASRQNLTGFEAVHTTIV